MADLSIAVPCTSSAAFFDPALSKSRREPSDPIFSKIANFNVAHALYLKAVGDLDDAPEGVVPELDLADFSAADDTAFHDMLCQPLKTHAGALAYLDAMNQCVDTGNLVDEDDVKSLIATMRAYIEKVSAS